MTPRYVKLTLALVNILVCTCPAQAAQLNFTAATFDSAGDLGDPDNDGVLLTYNGPDTIFTEVAFTGVLNSVNPDTFAEEAGFVIANVTRGYEFDFFTNALAEEFVTLPFNDRRYGAFAFVQTGDQFTIEAVEDLDDAPGVDARWTDLSFELNDNRPFADLGQFAPGSFDITTSTNSPFLIAALGLYDSHGTLLGQAFGGESFEFEGEVFEFDFPLNIELQSGRHYLLVADEDTAFGDSFGAISVFEETSGDADRFLATINNQSFSSGELQPEGPSFIASFLVIPEPTTAALVIIACLVASCRSKRPA